MIQFINGILISADNVKLMRILSTEETGEIMKAIFKHATGNEPDEAELSSEKVRVIYEIVKNQVDLVAARRPGRFTPEKAR